MFDHRHCHQDRWAAGRHHRRGRFGRHGFGGGRHGPDGRDGDDMMRAGRLLAQGDLRLIALTLIAEQPRHGYEIIKLIEEKTADWYSPSPGIIYPTLTYLEELGYLTAQAEGAKKLYTITDDGRAHLAANRDLAQAVLDRLAAIGEKAARIRRMREQGGDDRRDDDMPRSIRGAFEDLSEAVRELLRNDREAKGRIIETIDRATAALRQH
jgi:DNA-binding PadR family transcriptional regulator